MINYYNGVEGFVNYTISNPKNISRYSIRFPCKMCKIKKVYISICCYDASFFFKKRFIEKYLCWFAHIELYVLYETMVERMIGSLSNSSNMHEVVDDNSNHY